jgi:hypothetical protein
MMKKIIFALTFVSMIAVVNQSFAGKTGTGQSSSSTESRSKKTNTCNVAGIICTVIGWTAAVAASALIISIIAAKGVVFSPLLLIPIIIACF